MGISLVEPRLDTRSLRPFFNLTTEIFRLDLREQPEQSTRKLFSYIRANLLAYTNINGKKVSALRLILKLEIATHLAWYFRHNLRNP